MIIHSVHLLALVDPVSAGYRSSFSLFRIPFRENEWHARVNWYRQASASQIRDLGPNFEHPDACTADKYSEVLF